MPRIKFIQSEIETIKANIVEAQKGLNNEIGGEVTKLCFISIGYVEEKAKYIAEKTVKLAEWRIELQKELMKA